MADALIIDETPNVVEDEEGFVVARFRFVRDATAYVEAINLYSKPCANYRLRDGTEPHGET